MPSLARRDRGTAAPAGAATGRAPAGAPLVAARGASVERHMTDSPACLHEAEALEGLACALRAPPRDEGGVDMLHVRRERTRLLAAFDRALVAPEQRLGARRRLQWS